MCEQVCSTCGNVYDEDGIHVCYIKDGQQAEEPAKEAVLPATWTTETYSWKVPEDG